MNPVLVHYIPREAIWAASLLLYGPFMSKLIDQDMRLHVPIMQRKMQTDVAHDSHLNAWYRVLFSYCEHVYLHEVHSGIYTGLIGSTDQNVTRDVSSFECQSGEADVSTGMDESLTDTAHERVGDTVTDASAAAVAKNIQSHSSNFQASTSMTVDPSAASGFGQGRWGGRSSAMSSQDKPPERYVTLNKGTRFERRVREER
jgi:hypothetical protein